MSKCIARPVLTSVVVAAVSAAAPWAFADATTRPATPPVRIRVDPAGAKPISTDLIGIFFEDINDAADGGLYAELVQNRSFEYSTADSRDYKPLTAWELRPGGVTARLETARDEPVHPNNPTYAVLSVDTHAKAKARVVNGGFGGIAVKAGEAYDVSLLARTLGGDLTLTTVSLETAAGDVLASATLPAAGEAWGPAKARLTATKAAADARLVLEADGVGRVAFDFVSLMPVKTFKSRPNGMRADLAQVIADLKPKFMRFPGGCVAHGNTLANMYRWKDTVGPVHERRVKNNLWGYQQGYGLGYFEFFQFCEDIGAAPLPVVAAGVSCQFAPGGQKAIPMSEMGAYVQEVLDLIEWANGPADSTWGRVRADAGHPQPFGLKYVGVGNEDAVTPAFSERFKMINDAVKAKYPDVVLIGTSGPFHSGRDFDRGWAVSREMNLKMVDEHYYVPPAWLLSNNQRYDDYPRGGTDVYLGEYAAHDEGRRRTLRAAIAEAAFLTGLERNADVVKFASYAPLLGKIGRTRWDPNLIYFTNDRVVPTLSYEVQKLFGTNNGNQYLPTRVEQELPKSVRGTQVALGTWNTQAEFDDVRVTSGGRTVTNSDFAKAAADNDMLADWQPRGGRWRVTDSGTYRQSGNGQPALSRLVPRPDNGDYTLSLRARKTGGGEGFLIGFAGVDDENFYWWNLGGWNNTRHGVEKVVGGGKEPVGEPVDGRIETNRWYDVRVEVKGDTVRCLLDGKPVHTFRDTGFSPSASVFASTVRDAATGETVVKLVNAGGRPQSLRLDLSELPGLATSATRTVLTGDPSAENGPDGRTPLRPETSTVTVDKTFAYDAPPQSFTVLRLRTTGAGR